MGPVLAPSDPNAPPSRIADWPATPETTPPMPFTEWPYGGTTALGVTRPGSVDSPLMAAIANTTPGQWLNDNHFQIYGWVDPGFNISSNTQRPAGNAPIAYAYTPNTVQLDQAVIYFEPLPRYGADRPYRLGHAAFPRSTARITATPRPTACSATNC